MLANWKVSCVYLLVMVGPSVYFLLFPAMKRKWNVNRSLKSAYRRLPVLARQENEHPITDEFWVFMVKPHQANAKVTSLYWVHSISSLPATPSESEFGRNIAGNWAQNPFCCDFASKIAVAFALVWLDHNVYDERSEKSVLSSLVFCKGHWIHKFTFYRCTPLFLLAQRTAQ